MEANNNFNEGAAVLHLFFVSNIDFPEGFEGRSAELAGILESHDDPSVTLNYNEMAVLERMAEYADQVPEGQLAEIEDMRTRIVRDNTGEPVKPMEPKFGTSKEPPTLEGEESVSIPANPTDDQIEAFREDLTDDLGYSPQIADIIAESIQDSPADAIEKPPITKIEEAEIAAPGDEPMQIMPGESAELPLEELTPIDGTDDGIIAAVINGGPELQAESLDLGQNIDLGTPS